MKNIIAITALALGLALAGCNSNVTLPTAAQVIAATQQACSYTPLLTDVQAVLNAEQQSAVGNDVATAQVIANQVCAAIAAATTKPGAAGPVVATVTVGGKPYVVHATPVN
jgi:hypothetical protein